MCGRFALYHSEEELAAEFHAATVGEEPVESRYNVAPSQAILTLPAGTERVFERRQWGLVPAWATGPRKPLINVRADTLAAKSYFRAALSKRRCLIPASGFYEWKEADNPAEGGKTPIFFHPSGNGILALAGVWDERRTDGGSVQATCAIITTEPNSLLSLVHNRMPVILPQDAVDAWLDPGLTDTERLVSLLVPALDGSLEGYPVSRAVNSPANDNPDCVKPVGTSFAFQ